ncbi:MAG: putative integral rane protein, partial [Frankiales bacterium]|nr:putative integral rane protein [Frankiales bacterium]
MSGRASRWGTQRGRARLARELALLAALYAVYSLSRMLVDATPEEAVLRGLAVLGLERDLGLDIERGMVDALLGTPGAALVAGYLYASLHYTVTPAVLLWLYRSHPVRYGSARTVLAASTLVALVGYWRWPTAPPRLLPGGGYPDVLWLYSRWGWWGADASAPRGLGALTNEYAAMPSMHVGWALWAGLAVLVFARRRWVRALGAAYPAVTVLVVIATSNHYLLDAVAGAAVVLAVATAVLARQAVGRARPAAPP